MSEDNEKPKLTPRRKDPRVWGAIALAALVGFLIGMVLFGKPWHLPPAWGDVPTWLLAVGAIVTAVFAILAFGKQSQEVKDQAEMLRVQSDRLTEERGINALQADELRESLRERERAQADGVLFAWWPASHVLTLLHPPSPFVTTGFTVLVVENMSARRIVNVTCRVEQFPGAGLALTPELNGAITEAISAAHRATIRDPVENPVVPLVRASASYGFYVRFDLEADPEARHALRFTDDAGLHWQIDQDLHLAPVASRDDW